MKHNLSAKKGFTLVELLIVIVVIAILAVGAITVFPQTQRKARNTRRQNDILAISKALEARYNTVTDEFCTGAAGTYCAPVAAWFAANALPVDPVNTAPHTYTGLPANGAVTYTVCARLEPATPTVTFCRSNQQ